MPDLALLLRRLRLAALYLESALGKAGGLSGRSKALAVKGFPAPMVFAVIAGCG
jgi:putative oxidoreductase